MSAFTTAAPVATPAKVSFSPAAERALEALNTTKVEGFDYIAAVAANAVKAPAKGTTKNGKRANFDHSKCDHARTPGERAKCRRAMAKAAAE